MDKDIKFDDSSDEEIIFILTDIMEEKVKSFSLSLLENADLIYDNSHHFDIEMIENDLYYKTLNIIKINYNKVNLTLFKTDPEIFKSKVFEILNLAVRNYLKHVYKMYHNYQIKDQKNLELEEFFFNNIPDKIGEDFTNKILENERITAIVKCILSAKEKIKDPYIRMVLEFTFEGYNIDEIFTLLDGSYSKKNSK